METINGTIVYSVKDVAQILHVNITYVHRLRKAKLLPFLKIGHFKCRKESLEKFLADFDGKDVDEILLNAESKQIEVA